MTIKLIFLHIFATRNKKCKKENRIPQTKFSFHGNQIKYILKGIVNLFSEIKGELRSQYDPEAFHARNYTEITQQCGCLFYKQKSPREEAI